jgi:hypothetical protein
MRKVYRSSVHNGLIRVPDGAALADGIEVDIYCLDAEEDTEALDVSPTEQVKQALLRAGLLTRIARPQPDPPGVDRTPIEVAGEPVSEMIIRERR